MKPSPLFLKVHRYLRNETYHRCKHLPRNLANRILQVHPTTCEADEVGVSMQQPQTNEAAEKIAHEPLVPEPPTEGNTDHNGHTEQGTATKDDTATPDSAPIAPHREEQQPIHDATHETTPEVGQDTRTEPGILDILDSE